MPIHFQCQCGKAYNVADDRAGQRGRCPCGLVFVVPMPAAASMSSAPSPPPTSSPVGLPIDLSAPRPTKAGGAPRRSLGRDAIMFVLGLLVATIGIASAWWMLGPIVLIPGHGRLGGFADRSACPLRVARITYGLGVYGYRVENAESAPISVRAVLLNDERAARRAHEQGGWVTTHNAAWPARLTIGESTFALAHSNEPAADYPKHIVKLTVRTDRGDWRFDGEGMPLE